MKNLSDKYDYFLIIVVFCIALLAIHMKVNEQHKEQMEKLEYIELLIQQRAVKDTLYWKHLENCAFIQKDNIGVGYQGYLYDKYHRKYIKK